jgi:hypothetical protein
VWGKGRPAVVVSIAFCGSVCVCLRVCACVWMRVFGSFACQQGEVGRRGCLLGSLLACLLASWNERAVSSSRVK